MMMNIPQSSQMQFKFYALKFLALLIGQSLRGTQQIFQGTLLSLFQRNERSSLPRWL